MSDFCIFIMYYIFLMVWFEYILSSFVQSIDKNIDRSIKHRLFKYSDVTITLNNIENIEVLLKIVWNNDLKKEIMYCVI